LAHKLSLGTGNVGKSSPTPPPLLHHQWPRRGLAAEHEHRLRGALNPHRTTQDQFGQRAIQALNQEPAAGINGSFTAQDLTLLKGVAEYSATP